MGVALQGSLGVAVLRLVAGEVPDDQGLVSATGQEHVGAVFPVSLTDGTSAIREEPRGCRTSPWRWPSW